MYKANLILNNNTLTGTLDFYTLYETKKELKKIGIDKTITGIFKAISEFDMTCLSALVIKSIIRVGEVDEWTIVDIYNGNYLKDDLENFQCIFEYLNELMEECMPKYKEISNSESEFEDIPDEYLDNQDWDFDYMEYLWATTLKRNDFWATTPKNFFAQFDMYKKLNGIKDDKNEVI